jgi:hypothetical protein
MTEDDRLALGTRVYRDQIAMTRWLARTCGTVGVVPAPWWREIEHSQRVN